METGLAIRKLFPKAMNFNMTFKSLVIFLQGCPSRDAPSRHQLFQHWSFLLTPSSPLSLRLQRCLAAVKCGLCLTLCFLP